MPPQPTRAILNYVGYVVTRTAGGGTWWYWWWWRRQVRVASAHTRALTMVLFIE